MKKYFTWFNIFLSISILVATALAIVFSSFMTWLVWASVVFGILTAVFSAKGKWICFVFDLLSYAFYIYICLVEKYYGELILSVIVIFISIISLFQWKNNQVDEVVKINKLKTKEVVLVGVVALVALVVYTVILHYMGSDMIILNVLPTIVYLLGYYLCARRSILQFYCYIAYEILFIVLWIITACRGEFESVIFLVGAISELVYLIIGVVNWKKLTKQQASLEENKIEK